MKKLLLAIVVLSVTARVGLAQDNPARESAAQTYEHLAKVIVELRSAETSLVQTILLDHYFVATHYLEMAAKGMDVGPNLEAAANEITDIANEGDKSIQAVRQRLVAAGHHHHHHHSDADTEEDYVFINAKEKKAFLDLAGKIAKLGESAKADAITSLVAELKTSFDAAMAEEK